MLHLMGTIRHMITLEVATAAQRLGTNIRLARIRRGMSQQALADACDITRKTLYALEQGSPGTSLGTAFSVLWKLGLLDTASALADPDADEHGRILEAARRPERARRSAAVDNDF
jgi:DNA-binding XRE family transcriptional regulator